MNTKPDNAQTALVTGATSGIGLALAHEFAKHQHPLVLTARDEDKLKEVKSELNRLYSAEVVTVAADLWEPSAPLRIFRAVEMHCLEVDILVNNAGLGLRGKFWETSIEDQLSITRVNNEAALRLTHIFLPEMVKRMRGRILNTASIAGFEPGPLLAVYHASKAFLLSFSEALATELENTGVTVTALCPGATDTNFFSRAEMTSTRIYQKGSLTPPEEVAKVGYQACMRGDRRVVVGATNKALVFARRFMSLATQAALNQKFYEEPDEKPRRIELSKAVH